MNTAATDGVDQRPTAWRLLQVQVRVIVALMIREIFTRFGRKNIGFVWIVLEPTMFAFAVLGMWTMLGHSTHSNIPLAPFLITGYMPLLLYRHVVAMTLRCMQTNATLLYHRQVTVLAIYTSRMFVEFLGASAAFVVCMGLVCLFGFADMPADIGLMLLGWAMYFWFVVGLGTVIGGLSERSELVEKIWSPLSYISIPLSGTFFMVSWMPDKYRDLLTYVPQINGVEMVRGGYFGASVQTYFDPFYMAYCNAALLVVGLWLMKGSRDHVELE